MTVYYIHILALPVLLLISSIDLWMLLASVRLIMGWIPAAGRACQGLSRLTDPVPQAVRNWLSAKLSRPVPVWLAWLLVGLALMLIRQLLVCMIFNTR